MRWSAPCCVGAQNPQQIIADRHQSGLVKLALADAKYSGVEINIGEGEGKRFADAQTGAIQQEQDRPKGIGIDPATRMVVDHGHVEQTLQLLVRVDVGNERLLWSRNRPW